MADKKKLAELMKALDKINLSELTIDDIAGVENPILAESLRQLVIDRLADVKDRVSHTSHPNHLSHFSHLSHNSSFQLDQGILEKKP